MPSIDELIKSVDAGEMAAANQTFSTLMQDRLNDTLDDRKIELAQAILGLTSNDDDDEDHEGSETTDEENDDEVQGVSD